MHVLFVERSRNSKIGPIPATYTEPKSCPNSCPLKAGGCYAKGGHTRMAWDRAKSDGITWAKLCASIAKLATGQLWRHNVAGDLPHKLGVILGDRLQQLVEANRGKRGFTYTHHNPRTPDNHGIIKWANSNGFTVNLSANTLSEVDALVDLKIGPVVTVLPENQTTNTTTAKGRVVVVCPATQRDEVTCSTCKLCAVADRSVVVGFPAHGVNKKKAEAIATIGG